MTGTNNVPLGTRRRFGSDRGTSETPTSATDEYNPSVPSNGYSEASSVKRGRSPVRRKFPSSGCARVVEVDTCVEEPAVAEFNEDGTRKRKKKNRWGDATDNKAAGLMGLPTKIEAAMTSEQLEAYTLHLRIEEISQKLRINDVVPADGDRYV